MFIPSTLAFVTKRLVAKYTVVDMKELSPTQDSRSRATYPVQHHSVAQDRYGTIR
jgi:hypothetical protein